VQCIKSAYGPFNQVCTHVTAVSGLEQLSKASMFEA